VAQACLSGQNLLLFFSLFPQEEEAEAEAEPRRRRRPACGCRP